MYKVKNSKWETAFGKPCIVIEAENGTKTAMPLEALAILGSQARMRLNALGKEQSTTVPQWHFARFHHALTAVVGTVHSTEPKKVGLILDPGEESELSLSIPTDNAREIARRLVAVADQIEGDKKQTVN